MVHLSLSFRNLAISFGKGMHAVSRESELRFQFRGCDERYVHGEENLDHAEEGIMLNLCVAFHVSPSHKYPVTRDGDFSDSGKLEFPRGSHRGPNQTGVGSLHMPIQRGGAEELSLPRSR